MKTYAALLTCALLAGCAGDIGHYGPFFVGQERSAEQAAANRSLEGLDGVGVVAEPGAYETLPESYPDDRRVAGSPRSPSRLPSNARSAW